MDNHKQLTFALFGNTHQPRKSSSVTRLLDCLHSHGARVIVDRELHALLSAEYGDAVAGEDVFDGDDFSADFAVSMGGDGTFLKTAVRVGTKEIPIIGINTGRLGFLADVLPGEISAAISAVYDGCYDIKEHSAIQIITDGEPIQSCRYALNDIAVLKRDEAAMITIRTCVDGEYLVTYQADGLIVCTPTGSTAYSLSNGGPIIVPQTGSLCLTPVAPHSLSLRPIVVSGDSRITLDVESRSHNFLAAIDGRSVTLKEGTTVTICKAPFTTRIVKRGGQRYFASLREKMMWGADARKE